MAVDTTRPSRTLRGGCASRRRPVVGCGARLVSHRCHLLPRSRPGRRRHGRRGRRGGCPAPGPGGPRCGRGLLGLGLAVGCLLGLGRRDLALAQQRVDAGDLLADLTQPGVVVELAGDVLEAEVEQLLAGLDQPVDQLVVVHLAELGDRGRSCHTPASRDTMRALIGSFWMARSRASLARRLGHAAQLEHDPAGLDHGHPPLGVALARAHAGLGRLLGDRLVGEDVDPDLAHHA